MVFLFTGSLFYMDHVRRSAKRDENDRGARPRASVAAASAAASSVASMSALVCARLGNNVS